MSRFLLGFTTPLAIALGVLLAFVRSFFLHDVENVAWLLALLIGVPVSAAIVACQLAQCVRRPRCLSPGHSGFVVASLRGGVAGSATLVCALVVMSAVLAHRYSDTVLLAAPALFFALAATLTSRRVYVGGCAACGYDLTGTPEDRCPECGAFRAGDALVASQIAR